MATEPKKDEQTATLYQAILDDISGGRLVGGQRLKVSELASRFGVSASPVREALRQMQGEGFVEIHPNRGATVKQADASTIQNIFEVLQLFEPYFVGWFAEHARVETIDRLQAIQDQVADCDTTDLLRFRKLDSQFHGLICDSHYNDAAAQTWKRLRTALAVHSAPLRIGPIRLRNIITEHDALIKAFRANDAEMADQVIRRHLEGSFVQMSQQMRALGL